jgi:hypothetical protein
MSQAMPKPKHQGYVSADEAVLFIMELGYSWEKAKDLLKESIAKGELPTWQRLDDGFLRRETPEEALKNIDEDLE